MMLDPNDFIITRKRKKYRFAKFHNATNCFELDEWQKRPVDGIELGAGNGLFSVELAARYPEKTFVAVDVKADRLQHGAYAAQACDVHNIFFVRARADQLADVVPPGALEALWLTFPDPFPKKRSAGRRLTHPNFLALYADLLLERGRLYLKHDNLPFFQWSLEQAVASRWSVKELSFDLHDSSLADDYKILTTYEKRWLAEGSLTNFVSLQPPA